MPNNEFIELLRTMQEQNSGTPEWVWGIMILGAALLPPIARELFLWLSRKQDSEYEYETGLIETADQALSYCIQIKGRVYGIMQSSVTFTKLSGRDFAVPIQDDYQEMLSRIIASGRISGMDRLDNFVNIKLHVLRERWELLVKTHDTLIHEIGIMANRGLNEYPISEEKRKPIIDACESLIGQLDTMKRELSVVVESATHQGNRARKRYLKKMKADEGRDSVS